MSRIIIDAVKQEDQRYDTTGDWFFDPSNGDLHIRVTGGDALDEDEAFLVALHELIEVKLCQRDGITQGAVDAFDMQFEKDRAAGLHEEDAEPGDHKDAPYREQHRKAMLVEHLTAILLGRFDYGRMD